MKQNSPTVQAIVDPKMKGDKIFDLIRFIRNKSEHYGEQKEEVKSEWGPKPDETTANIKDNYYTFWAKHFPHLLIHIWRVINPKISIPEEIILLQD